MNMKDFRFLQFTHMLDEMQKTIKRIHLAYAPLFGVKSVHIFWLYELLGHPDGLTAAELAARRGVDRSLISREIADLKHEGLVEAKGGVRGYNARLVLTDKGRDAATHIRELAYAVQCLTDEGITEEELHQFYAVVEKLKRNLTAVSELTQEQMEEYLQARKGISHENAEA
jgi:DNA-binding MarR family transcriptional regulator